MILGRSLAKQFLEMGIDSLYVRGLKKPFLQHLGLKLALYNWGIKRGIFYGNIISEELGIHFLSGRGLELATNSPHPQGEKIPFEFPEFPVFIIDLALWDRHSPDEKKLNW